MGVGGPSQRETWDDEAVDSLDDADADRAPICPNCGVTALPADPATVIDTAFVCENPDCEAFGERIG
jgi:hypothetical protein